MRDIAARVVDSETPNSRIAATISRPSSSGGCAPSNRLSTAERAETVVARGVDIGVDATPRPPARPSALGSVGRGATVMSGRRCRVPGCPRVLFVPAGGWRAACAVGRALRSSPARHRKATEAFAPTSDAAPEVGARLTPTRRRFPLCPEPALASLVPDSIAYLVQLSEICNTGWCRSERAAHRRPKEQACPPIK
ncbi:hypothetical protein MTP03_44220 [Tsukamurella sp. PLM1]|nr:hypothetical protein MTP03_44220 [Tsukamurella sp. PLM1]